MAHSKYKVKTLTLPDGTRKYIYGKTKKEVEEKYHQARLQLNAGVDLNNRDTFGEFAQMWFTTFKKGTVDQQTEAHIKRNLNVHIMPILAVYRMKDITPMLCKSVFSKMTAAGLSNGLEQQTYQIMKAIFDVAEENGVIYKSPITRSVKPNGYVSQKRKALTDAQIEALKNVVRGTDIEPFVLIGLGTGMRRGEILGLQWDDVDMIRREIHVRHNLIVPDSGIPLVRDTLKTSAAHRTIPFDNEVYRPLLVLWARRDGGCVFHRDDGSPYTAYLFNQQWKTVQTLGLGRALTPHILRHTAITKWIEMGLDLKEVQYLAGHSNAQTTMNVYADYLTDSRYEKTRAKIQAPDRAASEKRQA